MTFQDVYDYLSEAFPGEYFSINYEIAKYKDKVLRTGCRIYLDRTQRSYIGPTFEVAILHMNLALNPPTQSIPEDLPQIAKEASNG